jgi:hypothetical protein
MSVSTLSIMCDIIKEYMALHCSQIWIYNQKRNIPTDFRLYVIVEYAGGVCYSSSKNHEETIDGLKTINSQKMQETIRINLISADPEALNRVGECIGALSSDYSQNIQATQGLAIAPVPTSVLDASAAEVTRHLFRTIIEVKVSRAYVQEKTVPCYDDFSFEISNEKETNL